VSIAVPLITVGNAQARRPTAALPVATVLIASRDVMSRSVQNRCRAPPLRLIASRQIT
jgi:hypothetical protein